MTRRSKGQKHGGGAPDGETPERVIITKRKIYSMPAGVRGVPVEEFFAGVELPKPIKGSGAKIYHLQDGPVLAMPAPGRPKDPSRRRATAAERKPTP